jgi:hypothetical protein
LCFFIRFLLRLGGTNENAVNVAGFQQALAWIFAALVRLKSGGDASSATAAAATPGTNTSAAASRLAKSLTHDLEFPGLKRKHSVTASPGKSNTVVKGAETAEYYQVSVHPDIFCLGIF